MLGEGNSHEITMQGSREASCHKLEAALGNEGVYNVYQATGTMI